jgi:hypothetical protein
MDGAPGWQETRMEEGRLDDEPLWSPTQMIALTRFWVHMGRVGFGSAETRWIVLTQ